MTSHTAAELLTKVSRKNIWDEEPVFCFSSDIDWASEETLQLFFESIPAEELKLTTFVTHPSEIIDDHYHRKIIDRGIHPNFLKDSSQGNDFRETIEYCKCLAPEAIGSRSHRGFDVTDVSHLLQFKYGIRYSSNTITMLSYQLRPILHESCLIQFPVFFEDGTFLYNEVGLDIKPFMDYFTSPGLKIISFHPMNMVFNTPYLQWMRKIKDALSREVFLQIDRDFIHQKANKEKGVYNTVMDIIEMVKKNNVTIFSMNELYNMVIE